MEEPDYGSNGTNELLAEILAVLERMDGRLKGQDERLANLEKTVEARKHGNESHDSVELVASQSASVDTYSPNTSPTTRHHGPKLRVAVQGGMFKPHELHRTPGYAMSARESALNRVTSTANRDKSKTTTVDITSGTDRTHSLSPKDGLFGSELQTTTSPATMEAGLENELKNGKNDSAACYAQYPPPRRWVSTSLGRPLDVRYGLPEAQELWTTYVGDSWTIPPDGRVELSFQQHLLERLDKDHAVKLLKKMEEVSNMLEYQTAEDRVKRGSFRVSDFDIDSSYQESGADYRAEFSTGMYKARPVQFPHLRRPGRSSTAPWKRMIEIRGLSKKLTPEYDAMTMVEHEIWSSGLRDPWIEALPNLNKFCPFLTHRDGSLQTHDFHTTNSVDRALLHHQRCLPYIPPREDKLCFHVTFYELINVASGKKFENELWKTGKLHSDDGGAQDRRLRESACTIILVCDSSTSKYWTSLYLCPFNFGLYEKVPSIISTQDALSVAVDMIEFTMRMVTERWQQIAEYFARLIGHREALADPEVHDSLLFDDDSFSRSRRYFWAINYLAELDVSIGSNIAQLERWIDMWPQDLTVQSKELQAEVRSLPERLEQLRDLQGRLRAQRQEAFALRDGLFSASGVIESRAATRLGENVKLLTSVSIFFLPLSFCMSLWSVNNTLFSLPALAIVAVLVSVGTYLTVFNLNNLVGLCTHAYRAYKRALIQQMKDSPDPHWSDYGKRFETFRPKAENPEPSDWNLAMFWGHMIAAGLGLKRIRWRGGEGRENWKRNRDRERDGRGRRVGLPGGRVGGGMGVGLGGEIELDLEILGEAVEAEGTDMGGRKPGEDPDDSLPLKKSPHVTSGLARLRNLFRKLEKGSEAADEA